MSTPNIFDMYQAEEEEEVPQLQRRSKKRAGETSQGPSAKKSRPEDLPQGTPTGQSPAPTGRTPTPPPAPSEQQNTPARSSPPPAPAREHLSREEAHEARLVSRTIRSAKDRIERIGKGERVGAAMIQAVELPVDQILNRALNEISNALLSAITARTRAQAYFEQIEAKVLEKHQVKAAEELSAAEAKHAKELETVVRERDAAVTKLSAAEAAKDAAVKLREEYRSYNKTHLREIKHLEGVVKSKDETIATLEGKVQQSELDNSKNLEKYKRRTLRCFYNFWKHNQGADFSYLSEEVRVAELARCAAQLAEEEARAAIPATPSVVGLDEETIEEETDQVVAQDPPAPHAS
ncbi:uncharacterized protein LOC133829258 [Humulus lupulus]|uniref:uncharacterized protein LOC133829258 n=1 Tax=Humulus lupulus TaxID=3486 RepID=UPI002B415FE4|nr:uncharacterized protein LOC133829258 [Humulus lupulus]